MVDRWAGTVLLAGHAAAALTILQNFPDLRSGRKLREMRDSPGASL